MDVYIDSEEHLRRLEERWKYDADDVPPIGLEGTEEHDRELVDDYDTRYVLYWKYISSLTWHFSFLRHANPIIFTSSLIPRYIFSLQTVDNRALSPTGWAYLQ